MLDRDHPYKPLDFGNGRVAGSVNDQGRVVSFNSYHPVHGYVTLTTRPPFPNDHWYDPAFVRKYRAGQASPDLAGFGFHFNSPAAKPGTGFDPPASECSLEFGAMPVVGLKIGENQRVEILTFAPQIKPASPIQGAIQLCFLESSEEISFEWGGQVALTRASYAQLTEGGPIPIPFTGYKATENSGILAIENPGLGCSVALAVGKVGGQGRCEKFYPGWQITEIPGNQQLELKLNGTVSCPPPGVVHLAVLLAMGSTPEEARENLETLAGHNLIELKEQTAGYWGAISEIITFAGIDKTLPGAGWLFSQNLIYILACCCLPLPNSTTCLITDHQLLPLAWTRDSFYAVQALLALRKIASSFQTPLAVQLSLEIDRLVKEHLLWLFEVAERPRGYWGRAYLANGQCKDFIFQLDQQCYPLIELAAYFEVCGDYALVEKLKPHLEEILAFLLKRKASEAWLFPTSETPADDRVEMPYHFSSQLTFWQTLQRLAPLEISAAYSSSKLRKLAGLVREDIYRWMEVENQGRKMFCYLTDLAGNYRFYHDANDWPTVLAPAWGFCAPEDSTWRATLDFAFSIANRGGFYPGNLEGLGSVHTPHPWPLGDIQQLYLAQFLGDPPGLQKRLNRLLKVACWDGALPEAYSEETGQVASRHWFAWPGSMLSTLLL